MLDVPHAGDGAQQYSHMLDERMGDCNGSCPQLESFELRYGPMRRGWHVHALHAMLDHELRRVHQFAPLGFAHRSSLVVQLSSCCVASRPRPCHHPHPLWVRSVRRTTLHLATQSRAAAPQWGAIHLGTARGCAMSRTRSRARSPGAQAPRSRDTGRWSRS